MRGPKGVNHMVVKCMGGKVIPFFLFVLYSPPPPEHVREDQVGTCVNKSLTHKGLKEEFSSLPGSETKAFWGFLSLRELITAPHGNVWRMN